MRFLTALAVVLLACLDGRAQAPGILSFGSGCGGQGGPATLTLNSALRPGSVSSLQFTNLPSNSVACLLAGWSVTQWGPLPLPVSLASIGMPGCQLLVSPDVAMSFPTVTGTANYSLSMPLAPSIVGIEMGLQSMFVQPGLNAANLGMSQAVRARVAPMPATTSLVSSISQFGITYTFAQPVRAGQFANGDWFVVGPATLVGMQPPCTTVGGRVLHGAMINPDASVRDHGYDTDLYGPGNTALYHASLNVALGLSAAQPRVLQPNQSLIKVISNTDPNLLPQIRTCSVLTCVAQVPPADSFRPPYAGTDHQVVYDTSMLDWNVLASLAPAVGQPHIATEAAYFERPWLDHCPGWVSRYMHPIENMPDYGRDFTALYAQASLLCNLNVTQAERRLLLVRLVQIGIDFWGNVENGCKWEGVGGHGSGRKWPILFAGALLHDANMLAVGQNYLSYRSANGNWVGHFGEDCQTFYVAQTSPTQINYGFGGYSNSHLGMPEWGFSHVDWPNNDHEPWGQDSYRRCCTANAWIGEVLGARVMGLRSAWNHPVLFDYMDRFTQTEPPGWTREWLPWTGRMWDLHRASF
ncbi:MAG: hypothetical protein IT456_16970 [Planctomycetes bacterium]|nr:hypothetical protein [Planctomycetota bacterium]